jgi:hypothetical protein
VVLWWFAGSRAEQELQQQQLRILSTAWLLLYLCLGVVQLCGW